MGGNINILPLQKGIIYGPIDSRRLGKSLGINLMPTRYKLCSFNCVYCHYGITGKLLLDVSDYKGDLPDFNDVIKAIESALSSDIGFDFITFSGNGEPTLYPEFSEIVKRVVLLRDKYRKGAGIALLSNSSGLKFKGVIDSISKIDLPVFKLDAGSEEKFQQINRPAQGVSQEEIVEILSNLKNIYIQTVLMEGNPSNVEKGELEEYFEKIKTIKPKAVHIYSTDRPVPYSTIDRVTPERLKEIASEGSKKTGVKFEAFYIDN